MGHSVVTSSLMKSEILVNANTKYTNMRVNVPGVIYVSRGLPVLIIIIFVDITGHHKWYN